MYQDLGKKRKKKTIEIIYSQPRRGESAICHVKKFNRKCIFYDYFMGLLKISGYDSTYK